MCYFISASWQESKKYIISIWVYDIFDENSKKQEKIYNKENADTTINMEDFLNAKIFNNQSFLEIENDVDVWEIW